MSKEQGRGEGSVYLQKMMELAQTSPWKRVNNYIISGPINVPTNLDVFTAIFPTPRVSNLAVAATISKNDPTDRVFSAILGAKLPKRIEQMPIVEDELIKSFNKERLRLEGFPYIMFVLGKSQETQENVHILYAAQGFSPATALKELQDRVRLYKSKERFKRK